MGVTRRFMLGGLLGSVASGALANAPLTSPRPAVREQVRATSAGVAAPSASDLIAAAGLGGKVAFVLADAATGLVLEAREADLPMPPASTAKVVTSLYALGNLGSQHRFATRLIATGPVSAGLIQGDLILAGGGDPTLTTDDLGDMARALAQKGVRGVTGRFLVWGGALPFVEAIDSTQPAWLGYNPSVSGLNLNFNRVNFVWKRAGNGYEVGMDARADRYAPKVYSAKVEIADRDLPVYSYHMGKVEEWSVAKGALGKNGSRWLPVRRPALYAGDVFHTLARAEGVPVPAPEVVQSLPGGTVLAERQSDALPALLRDMMKFSTNMTAEAVGMTASLKRGVSGHAASGREMSRWITAEAQAKTARFADHSGLAGASRISAGDMVRVLVGPGRRMGIEGLMKEVAFRDRSGREVKKQPVRVMAKTGTLNFVSTLAGYMQAPGGSELAFAIFTGDVARRDAVPDTQRERPEGGRDWVRRSKRLQQQLIERWAAVYKA